MELDAYLEHVRADGRALVAAAAQAPRAPVPSCPEWDMTGLVGHTSAVHHWVANIVRTAAQERPDRRFIKEIPTDPEDVLAWYDEGLGDLVEVLAQADPSELVWNWFDDKPAETRFWHRRMAQETVVHRWDAQSAAGDPQSIDPALAVDGIDEWLNILAHDTPGERGDPLSGSLHLHATDLEGEWLVELTADHVEYREGHAKADAAIRGSASDLYLWTLNRLPADSPGLEVFGDPTLVDRWRHLKF
jgi:uncharacterized protein (TIGR03083 family)